MQEMDVFNWNRAILRFLGFDVKHLNLSCEEPTNDKDSWWIRILVVLKKLKIYVTIVTIISGGIVLAVYSAFSASSLDAKLISLMALLFFTVSTTMIWLTHRNFLRITKAMVIATKQLNNESITKLRRIDKKGIISRTIWMYAPGLVAIPWYLTNTIDTTKFFDLLKLKSMYVIILYGAAFALSFIYLVWVGNLYWIVLSLAHECAENCRDIIRSFLENRKKLVITGNEGVKEDFQMAKITLKKYFKFVHEINSSIGVIPMSLFALLFMEVIIAVSFSLSFSGHSTEVVLYGILAVSNQVFTVIQIIIVATKASNTIREAVIDAEELTAIPLASRSCPQVLETRRSLRIFLQSQTNVSFSAMSTFVLEPSVILSFFNTVVPFTVMFITTIIQIRGNNMTNTEGFKVNVTSTKT